MTRTPHYCGAAIAADQVFAATRMSARIVRDKTQAVLEKPSATNDATDKTRS